MKRARGEEIERRWVKEVESWSWSCCYTIEESDFKVKRAW